MLRLAHRLLLVLIVSAVIGGPSLQLAQSAQYSASTTMTDMPCNAMMPSADTGHGTPTIPCKGMTPDCIKQMGCVIDVALPNRFAVAQGMSVFSPIAYWFARSEMAGVVREPEDLPPRTT